MGVYQGEGQPAAASSSGWFSGLASWFGGDGPSYVGAGGAPAGYVTPSGATTTTVPKAGTTSSTSDGVPMCVPSGVVAVLVPRPRDDGGCDSNE